MSLKGEGMKLSLKRVTAACLSAAACVLAENPASPAESSIVKVSHYRFTGGSEREDSMWSALYAAKSGKLCLLYTSPSPRD